MIRFGFFSCTLCLSQNAIPESVQNIQRLFSAHPTAAILTSDELLSYFAPAVRAHLIAFTYNLQIKTVLIQQEIHDAHNNNTFFITPQFDSILHHDDFFEGIVNVNQ